MNKFFLVLFLLSGSFAAYADSVYHCTNIQEINGYSNTDLVIKTSTWNGKIKSVTLVNEIKINEATFENVENHFSDNVAADLEVDPEHRKAAAKLNFKGISKGRTHIELSDSLLAGEDSGYALYWTQKDLWNGSSYNYYFFCEKR